MSFAESELKIMKTKILSYAKQKYNTEPEYLWERNPDCCILRHRRNRKWYAVIMLVPRATLGLVGEGEVWIMDVKATADVIENIPDSEGFLPGYHMNKRYWMSILLDGTVPLKVVKKFLDESYELTRDKQKRGGK